MIIVTLHLSYFVVHGIIVYHFSGGHKMIILKNVKSMEEFLTLRELSTVLSNLSDLLPSKLLHDNHSNWNEHTVLDTLSALSVQLLLVVAGHYQRN